MQLPRLFWWIITTIILLILIAVLAPQQIPVSLYKLSLVTTAGVIGYWLDRSLFPYARPDSFIATIEPGSDAKPIDIETDDCSCKLLPFEVIDGDGFVFAMCMLRRAIIVGAAMLAIGLGA
jgi:hypothetical protein